MNKKFRQKAAAVVTTAIFAFLLWQVFQRLFVVIWVQTPWWGLLIMLVVLFLLIDFMVGRLFGTNED